jgi:hypothetical protein
MSQKNVKTVKIIVPNENALRLFKRTPVFLRLTRLDLRVGENVERVNHYQFSEQMRMFPMIGIKVEEIL